MSKEKKSKKIERKINGVLMGAIIGGAIGSVIGMKLKPEQKEEPVEAPKKKRSLFKKIVPVIKKVRKHKRLSQEEIILPEEELKKIPHE
jgi:gas vesicle protein